MWKAELSLSSAQPARSRPQLPSDTQDEREDGHRDVFLSGELRKAQREVRGYHRFRQLGQELLEVNEKICRARPVTDSSHAGGKKTAEAIHQEVAREVDQLLRVIFSGRRKTGRLDLEASRDGGAAAMHSAERPR